MKISILEGDYSLLFQIFIHMKIQFILLLSIIFAFSSKLNGQTDFRFISTSNVAQNTSSLESGPRFAKAVEVYQRLVEARGDHRFPVPAFKISQSTKWVAFLEGDGLSIGLEEKAFDLCMAMGEEEGTAAIAALLGHELTHFYEKHQWRSGFADAFQDLKVGKELGNIIGLDKVNNETQSDYLGGFLAFSAGYPVFDKMPELYDQIYQDYNLPDTMRGYATREDRKALAVKSNTQLKELVDIYEIANLLTAIGRYNDARAFYKHILIDYQGREIYNNLGVMTVLEALSCFLPGEKKYRLPIELDMRFGATTRDGYAGDDAVKLALLQEAITYFDNAISMDTRYAPAYLNKACAYYLLGDFSRARFYAEVEAIEKASQDLDNYSTTVTNAKILLALILEAEGKKNQAEAALEALKESTALAAYNWRQIKDLPQPKTDKEDGPEEEEIDDIEIGDINTFTRNNRRDRIETELFGKIDFRKWIDPEQLPHSKIFVCKAPPGDESPDVYFHLTNPNYPGATFDGFKVGTPRADITAEYKEPNFSLPYTGGEIMVYEQVLFIMDAEQKVLRWANYFKQS